MTTVGDSLPQLVSLKGTEVETCICYARKYLRRGAAIDVALDGTQPSEMVTAATTAANGPLFHQAILSFSVIVFGAQHKQAHIVDRGYAMHGVALQQLNQALSEPQCYTRDEVVLSVATLAILECAMPTGPKNYLKHMLGLERLLELRGSNLYCSPLSYNLYKSVRHMILCASLRMGKPSILATAEWKKVLRENCSDEEMLEQDLYDILADCTLLLADRNDLLANWDSDREASTARGEKVRDGALALSILPRAWMRRWEIDERNTYIESTSVFTAAATMQALSADFSSPSLTFFEFSNQSAASMFMFYNTTLIYIFQILASLPMEILGSDCCQDLVQSTLQDSHRLDDTLRHSKEESIAAERSAALEVCRCIPYYYSVHKSDSHTSPLVHWAITTAWISLRDNESAEGREMMDLLGGMAQDFVAQGLLAG